MFTFMVLFKKRNKISYKTQIEIVLAGYLWNIGSFREIFTLVI